MCLTSCAIVGKRLKFEKVVLVMYDEYFIAYSYIVTLVSFNLYATVSIENIITGHDIPDHTDHYIQYLPSVQQ